MKTRVANRRLHNELISYHLLFLHKWLAILIRVVGGEDYMRSLCSEWDPGVTDT